MRYRTRGDSTPQGKPRIYMAGHPEDMKAYFSDYASLILEKSNCVIYYDENPEQIAAEDILADQLYQMQLIVILVTSKLLCSDNTAMHTVFPYAVKNSIPVLPLLLESGIEQKYSKAFGDLQFLNPNDRDDTSISFDQKFSKFLQSVLVSDEQAKQIRAAFDAYIFMSYRKKDRAYANELMKLIHDHDFCQSIAIWYDEFLVPGENFNDAIRGVLEKSQLFALVVTPNLINEENYVKAIEYPMAMEAGKPILPAEMESVDRHRLSKDYPAIPDCVSPNDPGSLSAALLQNLAHLAKTHHENEPRHHFFMGLAYLSGIDVEVNHERALQLIQSAADAGLTEAIKKLRDMYLYGNGVKRSFDAAIALQEKLVTLLEEVCNTEKTEEAAVDYLEALSDESDFLYDNGQAKDSAQKKQQIIRTSMKISVEVQSLRVLEIYVETCISLGGFLLQDVQNSKSAENYYREGLKVSEFIDQALQTEKTHQLTASCYEAMGKLYSLRWISEKAEENFIAAAKRYEVINEEFPSLKNRRNLARIYGELGDLYLELKQLDKSAVFLQKAQNTAEQNFAEEPRERDTLIGILRSLGDLEIIKKSYQTAYAFLERMYQLASEEMETTGSLWSRTELSIACTYLGRATERMEQYSEALKYYEQALSLAEEVNEIKSYEQNIYGVAVCLEDLSRFHKKQMSLGQPSFNDLLRNHSLLDQVLDHSFHHRELAHDYMERAVAMRKMLCDRSDTPQMRSGLIYDYKTLAELSMKYQNKKYYYAGYMNACKDFVQFLKKESAENSDRYRKQLLKAFDELYAFAEESGDSLFACASAEHALELNLELVLAPENVAEMKALAIRYHRAAEQCCCVHFWTRAQKYYKEEFKLRAEIAKETNSEHDHEKCILAFYSITQIPYENEAQLLNLKQIYKFCIEYEHLFPESARFPSLKKQVRASFEMMMELIQSEHAFKPEEMAVADKLFKEAMELRLRNEYERSQQKLEKYFALYQRIVAETGSLTMLNVLRRDQQNSVLLCKKLNNTEWEKRLLREVLESDKRIAMKTGIISAFERVKEAYLNCLVAEIAQYTQLYKEGYAFFQEAVNAYPDEKKLFEMMLYFQKHSQP